MSASVANGIESSVDIEEGDSLTFHVEGSGLAGGHVLNSRYFNEVCHRAAGGLVVDERLGAWPEPGIIHGDARHRPDWSARQPRRWSPARVPL